MDRFESGGIEWTAVKVENDHDTLTSSLLGTLSSGLKQFHVVRRHCVACFARDGGFSTN